ncbi:MAG: flagellar export chaperone FliS [Phycisphaerae bacterium]|nr:flagellar export chaperone FliS [Phycisphaerae bacterium]
MGAGASNQYLRNQVMTASPEQLQMMLYDGAIRYARQGRDAVARNDIESSFNHLTRAQRIVLEMLNGLRPEVNADLCTKMASLYNFVYRRLVDGSVNKDLEAIDDALKILEYQRETWALLLKKLAEERGQPTAKAPPEQPVPESISVEG